VGGLEEKRNFFRPVFCHFQVKLMAARPPIFSGQKYFFPACFELFGWKIGHLATVVSTPRCAKNLRAMHHSAASLIFANFSTNSQPYTKMV
jgi:hypothetical protein